MLPGCRALELARAVPRKMRGGKEDLPDSARIEIGSRLGLATNAKKLSKGGDPKLPGAGTILMLSPNWKHGGEGNQKSCQREVLEPGRSNAASLNAVLPLQWSERVPRTCRHFGISLWTIYHGKWRFDRDDLTTLEEDSHRPHEYTLLTLRLDYN